MSTQNYSEYKVRICPDPECWGDNVTTEEAAVFAERHAGHLRAQFDGINVEIGLGRSVSGPDEGVVDEIREWISENWTAAL